MNRVLGDYMETMLYKVFVSVDEHTTVAEVWLLKILSFCILGPSCMEYVRKSIRFTFFKL